mgnify:CR=1 FL=1
MPTKWAEVEVEVDLDDFSDQELVDELQARRLHGVGIDTSMHSLILSIYEKRRLGINYDGELTDLIYNTIGRIS